MIQCRKKTTFVWFLPPWQRRLCFWWRWFVCLFVDNITQKVMNKLGWNFRAGSWVVHCHSLAYLSTRTVYLYFVREIRSFERIVRTVKVLREIVKFTWKLNFSIVRFFFILNIEFILFGHLHTSIDHSDFASFSLYQRSVSSTCAAVSNKHLYLSGLRSLSASSLKVLSTLTICHTQLHSYNTIYYVCRFRSECCHFNMNQADNRWKRCHLGQDLRNLKTAECTYNYTDNW